MLRKWLLLALKFLVSAALIWFLFTKIDLASAVDRLAQAAPGMLVLAAAILLVQVLVIALRWRAVLIGMGAPLPFAELVRFVYMGWFFNQALPSTVGGDAVRIYKAYRAGLRMGAAVDGVMLERFATVLALVLLVAVMQPFFLPRLDEATRAWMVPAVIILVLGGVAGIAILTALDRVPESLRHWRLVRGLAGLGADARRVFLAPAKAGRVLAWSVVGHLNVTLGLYAIARGLGLEVTLVDCLALFLPVILITTLPISIAGWGVREGSMVAAFALVGVPGDAALALSILFGLLVAAISLPGGVLWLASGGRGDGRADAAKEPEVASQAAAEG